MDQNSVLKVIYYHLVIITISLWRDKKVSLDRERVLAVKKNSDFGRACSTDFFGFWSGL